MPRSNKAQVESAVAVVASDQELLLEAQEKLLQTITALRNIQTAPQQASLAKARAQAADSQVMQRKAELEQAQLNLSCTIVRSPVTGIIGRKRVEVGQNVSVGEEVIDVVSLNDVWITVNFKETQLGRLEPGQPVEIRVDAYGRIWKGHVTNLGGGTGSALNVLQRNAIGNYVKVAQRVPVRIDFDRPQSQDFNVEGLLKPGLSVEPAVRVKWLRRTSTSPDRQPGSRVSASGTLQPWYGSLPSWACWTTASQRCCRRYGGKFRHA